MTRDKLNFGRWGEKAAGTFLTEKGLKIVEYNWRSIHGEIDIIAKDEKGYVFVEVKSRREDHFGFPEEAITRVKRKHLINCINGYIQEKQIKEEWRIDVISIRKLPNQRMDLEWFQNAINEE